MRRNAVNTTIGVALTAAFCAAPASAQQITGTPVAPSAAELKHRSHLPMPNTVRPGLITYDAKSPETKYPPIEQLRPPKDAPNVLIVLIDDAGFGSSSAFGGPCQTPTAEKLAASGLKYTRFHTTALSSPAGVNLGFDDDATADLLRRSGRLLRGVDHFAPWHRNSVLSQDRLGLILMDFHRKTPVLLSEKS